MNIGSCNAASGPTPCRPPRAVAREVSGSTTLGGLLILALCGAVCCGSGGEGPVRPDAGKAAEPHAGGAMIVILGASYAKSWEPRAIPGVRFANKGMGGQQSFEMLARFREDVALLEPRAVILWGYINDLFRSDFERWDEAKARARESFLEMIRLARASGIEPVLASEVTIRPKAGFKEALAGWLGRVLGKESYQDRVNTEVRELNSWLRGVAESEDLLLLDFEAVLAGKDGRRKKGFAREDGSHITPEGYAALDAYAAPLLAARFGRAPEPSAGD